MNHGQFYIPPIGGQVPITRQTNIRRKILFCKVPIKEFIKKAPIISYNPGLNPMNPINHGPICNRGARKEF